MCRIAGSVMRAVYSITAACGILMAAAPAALAGDGGGQWTMGGQDVRNWRNQDSTALNPGNAAHLKTKWVFTTGGDVTATPAVANGRVYFPDFPGNFYSVHARTGALAWKHQLSDWPVVPAAFPRNDPVV